jgi:hypothetical protein
VSRRETPHQIRFAWIVRLTRKLLIQTLDEQWQWLELSTSPLYGIAATFHKFYSYVPGIQVNLGKPHGFEKDPAIATIWVMAARS